MFEEQIIISFLDNAVAKSLENLKQHGQLTTEDAIPLMLKSQFNHIAHLDQEMVTKTEFREKFEGMENKITGLSEGMENKITGLRGEMNSLKSEMKSLKSEMKSLKWTMGMVLTIGFAVMASLQTYVSLMIGK